MQGVFRFDATHTEWCLESGLVVLARKGHDWLASEDRELYFPYALSHGAHRFGGLMGGWMNELGIYVRRRRRGVKKSILSFESRGSEGAGAGARMECACRIPLLDNDCYSFSYVLVEKRKSLT